MSPQQSIARRLGVVLLLLVNVGVAAGLTLAGVTAEVLHVHPWRIDVVPRTASITPGEADIIVRNGLALARLGGAFTVLGPR